MPIGAKDGCEKHRITNGQVAQRWVKAENDNLDCAVCICCFGPCKPDVHFCSKCTGSEGAAS